MSVSLSSACKFVVDIIIILYILFYSTKVLAAYVTLKRVAVLCSLVLLKKAHEEDNPFHIRYFKSLHKIAYPLLLRDLFIICKSNLVPLNVLCTLQLLLFHMITEFDKALSA